MSNGINAPYGLVAVESVSGDGATRKMREYKVIADTAGKLNVGSLFYGDPVKFKTGGAINANFGSIVNALTPAGVGTPANTVAGAFVGTFIGCQYTDPNTNLNVDLNYLDSTITLAPMGTISVFVNDDPNTIFKVQISTSADKQDKAVFLNGWIGQNAKLSSGGVNFTAGNWDLYTPKTPDYNPNSGNLTTKRSVVYLDGASIDTTQANAGFDVKIIGLAPSSSKSFANAMGSSVLVNKTPGVDMPFCDVLVKFNVHIFGGSGVGNPVTA